jgi:hypothetical protein
MPIILNLVALPNASNIYSLEPKEDEVLAPQLDGMTMGKHKCKEIIPNHKSLYSKRDDQRKLDINKCDTKHRAVAFATDPVSTKIPGQQQIDNCFHQTLQVRVHTRGTAACLNYISIVCCGFEITDTECSCKPNLTLRGADVRSDKMGKKTRSFKSNLGSKLFFASLHL